MSEWHVTKYYFIPSEKPEYYQAPKKKSASSWYARVAVILCLIAVGYLYYVDYKQAQMISLQKDAIRFLVHYIQSGCQGGPLLQ